MLTHITHCVRCDWLTSCIYCVSIRYYIWYRCLIIWIVWPFLFNNFLDSLQRRREGKDFPSFKWTLASNAFRFESSTSLCSSPGVSLRSPVPGTIMTFVFRIHIVISLPSFLVGPRYLLRTSHINENFWLPSRKYTHWHHLYWQMFEMSLSVPKVAVWGFCYWGWNMFSDVMLNIWAFNSAS